MSTPRPTLHHRPLATATLLALALASAATPLVAEEGGMHVITTIEASAEVRDEADIGDGGATLGRTGAGVEGTVVVLIDERWTAWIRMDAQVLDYDLSGSGVEGLLDTAGSLDTRIGVDYGLDATWGIVAEVGRAVAADLDSDGKDASSTILSAGARWRPHDRLQAIVGVTAAIGMEDTVLYPLIDLAWRPSDVFSVTIRGGEATVAHGLGERWDLFLTAAYDARQFRLDEAGTLPRGHLEETTVPVGAGIAWRPTDSLRITAAGGATVWGEITVLDADDDEVLSEELGSAAFATVSVVWNF